MTEVFFTEKQKFTQWWLWVVLIITLIILPINNTNKFNEYYLVTGVIILCVFYTMNLKIRITSEGIYYQFFPFHFKEKFIAKKEVIDFEAITYKPIIDYGGWGIRYGFKGKAYNVKGNRGIYISHINGKKILFGTQKDIDFIIGLKRLRDN